MLNGYNSGMFPEQNLIRHFYTLCECRRFLPPPAVSAIPAGQPYHWQSYSSVHQRIRYGVFLSRCSLRSLLCREVLWPSLLRTAVIPLCYFAVLCILHVSRWGSAGSSVGTVVMLCASCPSAASSVLMTASLGMDSVYGSHIIFMTSILSVFTIPMLALLTSLILL